MFKLEFHPLCIAVEICNMQQAYVQFNTKFFTKLTLVHCTLSWQSMLITLQNANISILIYREFYIPCKMR